MRTDYLTGSDDEELLLRMMHVVGLQPIYLKRGDRHLRLTEATVLIDGDSWPLEDDLLVNVIEWAGRVTGLAPDKLTVMSWMSFASRSAMTRLTATESSPVVVPPLRPLGEPEREDKT